MLRPAPSYHAHIYFREAEAAAARELHAAAVGALGAIATIWPMRMRPVGPHHAPMFEIEFPHASRESVLAWVEAHHGPFSVMLHPETDDAMRDHRDDAVWLGQDLGLDLSVLASQQEDRP